MKHVFQKLMQLILQVRLHKFQNIYQHNTDISCSKQGNGQTYAETLTLLQQIQPDEILLNEGRRSSQLVQKVLKLFSNHENKDDITVDLQSQKPDQVVVKFVPRTYIINFGNL